MIDISELEKTFRFPFKLHDYQLRSIAKAVELDGAVFRDKVGLGKTAQALGTGLLHSIYNGVEQILCIMPPALLDQFEEFVLSVGGIGSCLLFRGTPKEREKMDLFAEPVVLMSTNIFRSDFDRIKAWSKKRKLYILADELSLKAFNSTFKKFKELIYGRMKVRHGDKPLHKFCGMNATPVSDREQIYNWCAIFNPHVYPSKKIFELAHVAEVDHWGKVTRWVNIPDMDRNFDAFSIISENANIEIPESVYTKIPYSLERKHKALYDEIAEAEFNMLPENLIPQAVDAYFATMQRVVLVPSAYGLDIRSPILDIIDHQLDQMDEDDSVIIYTRHVVVSQMLAAAYPNAVSYFGKVSKSDKEENLRKYKSGEAQVMIANLDSLGKGQNLQIANHTILVELPFRSDAMTQVCGRTARQGQTKTTFFHIPLAKGTIQRKIYERLLENDADLLSFNRNKKTLKKFIND